MTTAIQEKPMMRLVIHAGHKNAEIVIDGHAYSIPPNEPFQVSAITGTDHMTADYQYATDIETIAKEMVSKLWHFGLVEVPVETVKTQRGITFNFDAPKALAESKAKLIKAEEKMLGDYVAQCRELISAGKSAQPPNGRVAEIIQKLGIDLKAKYGFQPIGHDTVASGYAKNEEMEVMRKENAELRERFDRLMAQLELQEGAKKTK